MRINYFIAIALFCFSLNGFSQNNASNKYAKQIQSVTDSYDQAKLAELRDISESKYSANKGQIASYALLHNVPVRYEDDKGTLFELQFIADDGTPIYYQTYNVAASASTRANYLNSGGGLGLNLDGDDLTAHVWDGGLARTSHQEYDGAGGTNRFSIGDGTTALHYHSAHVTGTIMASGVVANSKGMAPRADAVGYDWNSDVSEATTAAAAGMLISNHSYGYGASGIPDEWFGQYGSDARDWDQIAYNAPYFLMMVAAGNDGADNSSNGAPLDGQTAYDKLSGHATAKNNMVVANGQDASINGDGSLNSVTRNSGSSEGPTDDYRIKPDIMGNGTQLYSTYETSDTAYNSITGTSMASPNVAGTLLLLQEHYVNLHGSFMLASTLKGLALHTADDVAPIGPDAQTGWGLLNAKKAAETLTTAAASTGSAIVSELTLTQGQTYSVTVQSNGTDPLMASISWTDPAAAINNGTNSNTPALINDLDIRLENGPNYTPWKLTGVTTNGTGDNIVDPYERVDVSGATGTYTLTVTHKGTLSSGSQNYSLIVTGVVVSSTPLIAYSNLSDDFTEESDCNYTDINVPLLIAKEPSQDATVTFAVNGGTATDGLDYAIQTPTVTFLSGSLVSQNMVVRVYHDGFVEGSETAIIDFTVNANGGDAIADTNADSFTLTINDDDAVITPVTTNIIFSEDFENSPFDFTTSGNSGSDVFQFGGNGNLTSSYWSTTGNSSNFAFSNDDACNCDKANDLLTTTAFSLVGNYTSATLTFDHAFADISTEVGDVLISTGGAFTSILNLTNTSVDNGGSVYTTPWVNNNTINLTTYIGQANVRIQFRYNDGATWLYGMAVDNVVVSAESNTNVQTAVNSGSSNQILLSGAGTVYSTDAVSGDVMLDITNNNADDYGCVETFVSRSGTGAQAYDGSVSPDLVMDKSFDAITGNSVASGSTSVTFYATEAEVAGWETAIGGTVGVSRTDLVAAREVGGSISETSPLSIGTFGSHVTFTGNFTGMEGTFYFGPAAAFVVSCPGVTKTWNGSWSPTGAPGSTDTVIINATYNTTTNGNLEACKLTINSGATVTVPALTYIRVNGDITVDGTLDVAHTGSIVQVDDTAVVLNNGSINVNLTTPSLTARDFMIMGSPMSSEDETAFVDGVPAYQVLNHTTANFTPYVGSPAVVGVNFHDQESNDWTNFSGTLNTAEGYLVRPSYTQSGTYNYVFDQGTLNNGVITYAAFFGDDKEDSPNILSNPYASAIDATMLISSNAMIDEVYFWEHLTTPVNGIPGPLNENFSMEDISTYNGTMGIPASNDPGTSTTPDGVISTGQGFGIKANAGGNVTFNNAMRLTSGNTTLRRPVAKDLLWLTVREGVYHMGSTAGIGFLENATSGLDQGYDTEKLGTVVSLYTHLLDGSEQFGIQGREVFDDAITIPMGFSTLITEDGGLPYVISIADLEGSLIEDATVYLIDHLTNTITNLSEGNYEFVSEAGTYNNRFTVQFESLILDVNASELDTISVYPNPTQNILNIVSPNTLLTGIQIFDVRGRSVKNVTVTSEANQTIDISNLESAMYFVKISSENGSITKRIIKQ
ncbi:S8 family serine peptidase [Ulvibacter antarcticus]|uniref:Putative secreted protein (Por secretion system target) n=1 Tax=Ulvibacter antarcticus TaxID=442714 RepID=A0A3L9YF70_9FLAO|nr:S8 family serine peptidase [Ulvibacter antarcticus]RMA57759.1 putative secreted protein (Por secretion system target) [Ulvibacter antarcticus]